MAVVLHRPKLPENIGAAARAACNMGLTRLVVVQPHSLDPVRMRMMATQAAAPLLEAMEVYDDLAQALGAFQYVVGTTARQGGLRREFLTPREMAHKLVEISRHNRVALLFGPENWGLTNEELALCQALVTIPTAACSSLNLAQAVMVLAYEVFTARHTEPRFVPRLANVQELESMYAMLKDTLVKIHYIGHQNPDYWMFNVRRFFNRLGLRARETQVVKGICRQIDWYVTSRLAAAGLSLDDQAKEFEGPQERGPGKVVDF
ncbi:MAG: RNA methyltransferase [Desulfobaccales bacterium]